MLLLQEGLKMVIVKADKSLSYMRSRLIKYIQSKNSDKNEIEKTQKNLQNFENLISFVISYMDNADAKINHLESEVLKYKLQALDFHEKWVNEIEQHKEFAEILQKIHKKK